MKKMIIIITILGVLVGGLLIKIIDSNSKIQEQKALANYKTCILKQDKEQGYIIRSECSLDYKKYDEMLGFKYFETSRHNLYLKEEK